MIAAVVGVAAPAVLSLATTLLTSRRRRAEANTIRVYVGTLQSGIESFAVREGIDLELTQDEIREQIVRVERQHPDLNITVKPDGDPKGVAVHAG